MGEAFGVEANAILDRFNEVVRNATEVAKTVSYWPGLSGPPDLASDGVHFTVGYLERLLKVRFFALSLNIFGFNGAGKMFCNSVRSAS